MWPVASAKRLIISPAYDYLCGQIGHPPDRMMDSLRGAALFMVDALRLSQVQLNFLSNGVKFTPEGGEISATVHLIQRQGDTVNLRFAVSDSGIGITNEQLSRLFPLHVGRRLDHLHMWRHGAGLVMWRALKLSARSLE